MGVCQWQMLEDAISDYVKRQNITSDFITINATIIKSIKHLFAILKRQP